MNILKRKSWSARWEWCFHLWFLKIYVKYDSYLKKPDDLLLADMLSKPVIKWLKRAVHFLITRAVLASSSYFEKKSKLICIFLNNFLEKSYLTSAECNSIVHSTFFVQNYLLFFNKTHTFLFDLLIKKNID